MGILDIFNSQPTTPTVPSVLPEAARQQILRGQLPILQLNNLFLKNGELSTKSGFARIPATVCRDYSKVHEFMSVAVIRNM